MRLQPRIVVATMALVTIVVGLTGGLFVYMLRHTLMEQIGEDALDVARAVARIPEVRQAVVTDDPDHIIQPLAERIRAATGADFIVVGDRLGRRYSHPDPEKIGQLMVGGDNAGALEKGEEYVSLATGTLGPSMRGKVPILDSGERVVGVVSVGFLIVGVNRIVWNYIRDVGGVLLLGLTIGVPGALLLARSIKRAIHGLEPEEIAALAEQRKAIIGAIREGILAIDSTSRVIVANDTALDLIPGLRPGVLVRDVLPNSRLPEVLETGKAELDQQMLIDEVTMITNRIPVRIGSKVAGVVASFRDRSELERLTRQLSDTRRYTEELRAQAHDFANTLQVISGLLQLDQVDEAVDFIQDQSADYRHMLEALPRSVAEPAVSALLLGKRARAAELHCDFTVDPTSRLNGSLPETGLLIRVLGNLIDNALEAVQTRPIAGRLVRVRLADEAGRVCLEVADSGPGVPPEFADEVFREGFSTKAPGRGVGLALVRRLVDRAGGSIRVGTAPEGGALFRVLLPRPREV